MLPSILLGFQDGLPSHFAFLASCLFILILFTHSCWYLASPQPCTLQILGHCSPARVASRTLTGGDNCPSLYSSPISNTAGVFKALVTSPSLSPHPSIACVHLRLPCEVEIRWAVTLMTVSPQQAAELGQGALSVGAAGQSAKATEPAC